MIDRVGQGAAIDATVAVSIVILNYNGRAWLERCLPAAIAETKRLVYRHLGTGYEQALREAEVSQNRFVTAPDAVEGVRSFLERRPPQFARLGKEPTA